MTADEDEEPGAGGAVRGRSREDLDAEAEEAFLRIGLTDVTAKNAVKNRKFRDELMQIIEESAAVEGCSRAQGTFLYTAASKYPGNARSHRKWFLTKYVMSDLITSNAQLEGALAYLSSAGVGPVDEEQLNKAAGIGVEVTEADIQCAVTEVIEANKARLLEERYHMNTNILLGTVRAKLKWADIAAVKAALDASIAALLGPKTEADNVKPDKKKKKQEKKHPAAAAAAPTTNGTRMAPEAAKEAWQMADPYAFLPKPSDNNKVHTVVTFSDGRQLRVANSAAALADHLRRTGGRVVTRFPPEPNGYLHIGHAKAMFVDFGMAAHCDGRCFLRFDDTNPEAEKQEYIDHIQDIVAWMGWTPYKVTFSSDYFQELYDLAVKLIETGHAYVDHQTAEEISNFREERRPSPWRERPAKESMRLFQDMRRGLFNEGQATLRLKMDPKNDNYNMFDLIAYRIKFAPHPHAGPGWCIYPSYDYTHCLVDALEDVTHSLCTLEFETRRASYFWLLEAWAFKVLDMYKPVVWEYGRLNLTHNVLSKRKLNRLVTGGFVTGWDDPRLLTLAALRRRGVHPQAINAFCREMGITRAGGEVHLHKLEHHVRAELDTAAPRALAVLHPLRLLLTNLAHDHVSTVRGKVFPGRSEETYPLPLSRVVYIEVDDFRRVDDKGYFGLAPGKEVLLKYAGVARCTGFREEGGQVVEVQADFAPLAENCKPPKGVLNWVAEPAPGAAPPRAELRLYDVLFKSPTPTDLGDTWLEDLNPASLTVVPNALVNPALAKAVVGDRFQLERLGYFCVDPDTTPENLVMNRTCTLRESFSRFATS